MARLLLDTHTFLWLASGDARLTDRARTTAADPENDLFLSAASVWEMAIKSSLGRLELPSSVSEFVESQCRAMVARVLPIEAHHAAAVEALPFHHRDPFDRLLVSQASHESLLFLSRDSQLDAYGVERLWD